MNQNTIDVFMNDVVYSGTMKFIETYHDMTLSKFTSLPLTRLLHMIDEIFGKADNGPSISNPVRVRVVLGELVSRIHGKGLLMAFEDGNKKGENE